MSDTYLLLAAGIVIGWMLRSGSRALFFLFSKPSSRMEKYKKWEVLAAKMDKQPRALMVVAILVAMAWKSAIPLMALALLSVWL